MTENCFTRNPLVRDGVSQSQRILETLLPAYIPVDERSMKDLSEFAYKFSDEIKYLNSNNTEVGTWNEFFNLTSDWDQFSLKEYLEELKIEQAAKPHLALFFGFLYMFKVAQDDMNTITQRHLDFYYREVLQLKENPAVPDQVAIIFNLAKHVKSYLVKKGTTLKAGKDDTGVERWYEVSEDVAVNKASISELKSIYIDKDTADGKFPDRDHSVHASPIANSLDGIGGKIENEEQSWETFGKGTPVGSRSFADLGFALASPLLFLAEGERIITITFTIPTIAFNKSFDHDLFQIQFSGEKEWITPEPSSAPAPAGDISKFKSPTKKLILRRRLSPDQDAVVAYNQEELSDPFNTAWPVVKIILNQAHSQASATNQEIYNLLKDFTPTDVTLKIEVNGVTNLILQSDQAVLDASKPFQPFGNRPHKGSNFYIGNWEVFQKKLTDLSFDVKWKDLPETTGFQEYYANYLDDPSNNKRNNNDFKVHVSLIEKKKWERIGTENFNLFTETGTSGTALAAGADLPGPAASTSRIIIANNTTISERDSTLETFQDYNTATKKGFLRLSLRSANFGHPSFAKSFSTQSILLATCDGCSPVPVLPNEPYTPTIETLGLNYKSSEIISLSGTANTVDQFFHVHPFGVNQTSIDQLLPTYTSEGNLYLGIEGLEPPQTLSVLFQHAEGSANPESPKQTVTWSYLKDNIWVDLDSTKQILADGTNGLLQTGIILFDIPELISKDNTLLPAGLYWLRASVEEYADAVCDLIEVRAQAVLAAFSDNGNDPDHLRNPLEAGTIAKLLKSDSAIDKVEQPYASFGGQIEEQKPEFYTRISERLRHKHRAITIWDYEHLILQKYPDVYKVKCINHTRYDGSLETYSEIAPGHVTLLVISNVFNKNAVDPLRPKTSLARLSDIDEYIKTINPPCAKIYVKNPLFEEIKVDFQVKFHKKIDIGLHTQKLNQEIIDFLSPWASDCPKEVRFGGKIHKSMILNFVEERSYVDYVTCFKMFHIVPNSDNPDGDEVDEIVASKAITILGSHDEHEVRFIPTDQEDCVCEDNIILSTAQLLSTDDCLEIDPASLPDSDLSTDEIKL